MKKIYTILISLILLTTLLALPSQTIQSSNREQTKIEHIEGQIEHIRAFQKTLIQEIAELNLFIKQIKNELMKCEGRLEILVQFLEKAIEDAKQPNIDELQKQKMFEEENKKSVIKI